MTPVIFSIILVTKPSTVKKLTCVSVEGVSSLAQCGTTLLACEATAVEELALSTAPLQHVELLIAEVTQLAASYVCHWHCGHGLWQEFRTSTMLTVLSTRLLRGKTSD